MPKHQLAKKKKYKGKSKADKITFNEVKVIEESFKEELETNPKFSLSVDPLNMYNFSEIEVEFIEQMVQYKNIKFVSILINIPFEEAVEIYKSYNVQEEIKRINLAMYARRFCSKMADLDALGGYLTTALTDENVPIADRLSGKEKLAAVRLLIELNQIKADAIENPESVNFDVIEAEVRSLKVKDIEKLIENSDEDDDLLLQKNEIISKIDRDGLLTPEEVAYLRTQTLEELKSLLKEIERGIPDDRMEK